MTTLRLKAGVGGDDFIHLPGGTDRVACERKEDEDGKVSTASQGDWGSLPAVSW